MEIKEGEKLTFYIDKLDWGEIEHLISKPKMVFPTISSLKKKIPCWKECGIIKVEINFEKIKTNDRRK